MSRYIYKIGLAVIRGNKLLLCRPFAFDDLIILGGIKEGEETAIDNLAREIREELGEDAVLDEPSLRYLGNFSDRAAGESTRIVEIELYAGSITGQLTASSEIKELVWFSPRSDDNHKLSAVVQHKIIPFLLDHGLLRAERAPNIANTL